MHNYNCETQIMFHLWQSHYRSFKVNDLQALIICKIEQVSKVNYGEVNRPLQEEIKYIDEIIQNE